MPPSAPSSPAPRPKRRRGLRLAFAAAVGFVVALVGAGVLLGVVYTLTLVPDLPRLRAGQSPDVALASVAYTADGAELARFYHENRSWVAYDAIAPVVVEALLATEDHRFYRHRGVDWRRLAGSAFRTAQGDRQGGSTLTMQLARNLYPAIARAPDLKRKVQEVLTAFKMERAYAKEDILEMYLNTVPFGYNAFGIEAAAQTYFGKRAGALDAAEAALLVGMLKATTRYNPRRNPELARERRNVVLAQMARHGHLDAATAARLQAEPIVLQFSMPSLATSPAPHFAEHVRAWAEAWAAEHGYDLYTDGLRLHTTLDARLQALAQAAVSRQLDALQAVADYEWSRATGFYLGPTTAPYERRRGGIAPFDYLWRTQRRLVDDHARQTTRYRALLAAGTAPEAALARLRADAAFMDSLRAATTRLETGFVALDPQTGALRAWVGGRDFARDQYDHVALAKRQPGSTFKPFVYALAIDYGYRPDDTVADSARTYEVGGRLWRPTNSGSASGRAVTLRDALAYSKNTVTARLMHDLGAYQVAQFARRMGIRSELDRVPSLGLGTSEVTLLELVAAYNTLAQSGVYHEPLFVTRIEDRHGTVLATFGTQRRKAISMYTAYTTLDMMRGVIDRGTGRRIRADFGLAGDLAGKTGTTQHNADGWFVLMNPRLVAGAWVGFNDRRIAFRTSYWGQGGHNALNVVGDFFRAAYAADTSLAGARFLPPPGYTDPAQEVQYALAADSLYPGYDAYDYEAFDYDAYDYEAYDDYDFEEAWSYEPVAADTAAERPASARPAEGVSGAARPAAVPVEPMPARPAAPAPTPPDTLARRGH